MSSSCRRFELLRVKLQYLYEGNPGEINFGLGQQGFELSGVNCKPPSKMLEINRLPNLFTNCQSQITFMSVTVDLFFFYVVCFLNCINFVTYCVSKLQFQRIFFSEEEKSPLSALVFELAQVNQTMWGQHLFTIVTFETVLSYIALVHIILNRERNLQLLCGSQTRYLRK